MIKRKYHRQDYVFIIIAALVLFMALSSLILLLVDMFSHGLARMSLSFLVSFPSRFPEKAGILTAWTGTLFVIILTMLIAVPLGILTAVYLEEYGTRNDGRHPIRHRLNQFIELNIYNLAGVPSVVYGVMSLGVFVYLFKLGHSIITAAITLAFLILPIIIIASREALKTVPKSIREAAFALGANRYQTVFQHVVPYSMGGILTGVIIAVSRAIGETAPLIAVGAVAYIAFIPTTPMDPYTVLPIQMFNWISRPQEEFHLNAAAAGSVLLMLTFLLNGIAIYIRSTFRKRYRW